MTVNMRYVALLIAITAAIVFAVASIAVADTDGTGRAMGYWDAYEAAQRPYASYTTTDGTGRAMGYWDAYEAAQRPYASYTTTDGTGRAMGYWDAYEAAQAR